jgi:HAE1 family hydrophobic/amphiphilic exporter-1
VLVDSVLIPLEQSINGVQNMRYMVSDATSAGEATIRSIFEPGTDPNINVVNVQNRVNIMLSRLPPLVVREGILVSQVVPSMLMYVNLYSTDPERRPEDLYNYANVYVMPELKRIQGMGLPRNLGNRSFAMRIWLNPERMRAYNVSVDDVMEALAEQSIIGSPGRLGQATGMISQSKEYVLTYVGRFNKARAVRRHHPEANAGRSAPPAQGHLRSTDRPLRQHPGDGRGRRGCPRRLRRRRSRSAPASSSAPSSSTSTPTSTADLPGVLHRPQAGARLERIEVIEDIKSKLEEMEKSFPPGMKYEIAYDVSHFLDASIEKVLHTLLEAFILVSLVVYMFLGDLRSTLIPILAVPVSLIGAFFVLHLMGLSINLITLFAMVLAIGVVVDDAIVVVEAVHAKMHEKHSRHSQRRRGAARDQRRDHRDHARHDGGVRPGDLHPGPRRRSSIASSASRWRRRSSSRVSSR